MNGSGNLPASETAAKRVNKPKAQRKGRPKSRAAAQPVEKEKVMAAAGSLTRTKALLLAALRVWELKHRVNE
jgi:hypothetical protein